MSRRQIVRQLDSHPALRFQKIVAIEYLPVRHDCRPHPKVPFAMRMYPLSQSDSKEPKWTASQIARRRRARRYRGLLYLAVSIWLAVSGLTWLESRLIGLHFLLYWTLCAGTAILACLVALSDAMLLRAELRAEARERRATIDHSNPR